MCSSSTTETDPISREQNSTSTTDLAMKEPLLVISSQDISINLLSTLKLLFEHEIWQFSWQEEVSVLRSWGIYVANIDSLTSNKTELHDRLLKTLIRILDTIITEECYRQTTLTGDNICSNIDLVSQLRKIIGKPLLKSYIAYETDCVDAGFYIDHLKIRNGGKIGKIFQYNLNALEHGKPAEIIRFNIKLCH